MLTSSATSDLPKKTKPCALPTGPAIDFLGHFSGSFSTVSTVVGQVGKPDVCNLVPFGTFTWRRISGGWGPTYSAPWIVNGAGKAGPAPGMFPVCGKPEIGTASALKVTTGSAAAVHGSASAPA